MDVSRSLQEENYEQRGCGVEARKVFEEHFHKRSAFNDAFIVAFQDEIAIGVICRILLLILTMFTPRMHVVLF